MFTIIVFVFCVLILLGALVSSSVKSLG